ncbi:hypothetical protein ABG768_006054 [Culter alburnus]|uniref:Acyl-CoA oxidase/dehydrogenase middle domain-containing protein n=1 Tax=Culter alburnus TaxID=194366 RepID=A0AAW1ZXR0_CULAL
MDQKQTSSLARYLDGEFWEIKDAFRDAISKCELFQSSSYDLTLDQNRDLTAERLYHILRLPFMREHLQNQLKEKQIGFINKSFGITELICSADMATGVKLGVVCGLYGGAVNNLGSPEQKMKWYLPVSELQFTGMFAMTERGHGSNVRGIITEARYDQSTQEFIIHTPSEDAQKMYIGNALKGNYAAVFAQLIINGESQGPHCFIVPIRDLNGVMWPGVTTIDMKHKEGLNGVDNGILIFNNVRIPRENLLGKFGSVSAEGLYSSPVLSKSSRFNAMLAALTPTRLGLTVQAMAAMKRTSSSEGYSGPRLRCCSSVFLTCGFLRVSVHVRLRGWLQGVSEDGIPRVKKIQKERKCLLSIVAGFPFAKQLCTRTHIRGGTKSHGFGTKTRMSAQAPPGVIEKPHSQLSG